MNPRLYLETTIPSYLVARPSQDIRLLADQQATNECLDYLLTWNCRHINNPTLRRRIERACAACGLECPVICSPVELLKGEL